jgi:hypothetical protein
MSAGLELELDALDWPSAPWLCEELEDELEELLCELDELELLDELGIAGEELDELEGGLGIDGGVDGLPLDDWHAATRMPIEAKAINFVAVGNSLFIVFAVNRVSWECEFISLLQWDLVKTV